VGRRLVGSRREGLFTEVPRETVWKIGMDPKPWC
jgi:hypothetical protein